MDHLKKRSELTKTHLTQWRRTVEQFEFDTSLVLQRARIENLPWNAVLISAGLGFALSILFFMDQNITGQIVNSPTNNLKKGPAPHLDLFVLGEWREREREQVNLLIRLTCAAA